MPSISDKLKSLGVQQGAQGIYSSRGSARFPIDQVIDGQIFDTVFGQSFVA